MHEREHWIVRQWIGPNGPRRFDAESQAAVHELIQTTIETRGMACVTGHQGTSSTTMSVERLRVDAGAVTEIQLRVRPTPRDVRWELLGSLGLGDKRRDHPSVVDAVLKSELRAPFRVLVARCAGPVPAQCVEYLLWLWDAASTDISVLVEDSVHTRQCPYQASAQRI